MMSHRECIRRYNNMLKKHQKEVEPNRVNCYKCDRCGHITKTIDVDDGGIVIVTDGTYYNKASEWYLSIGTMAKYGGYYYYVLPELKIDNE